jgi:predicted Zn-ribbon and HTH transcriptional regulator
MPKVMLEGYRCERCGHEWVPRTKIDEEPTICPKCKSPYWNKARRVDSTEQARHAMKLKRKRMEEDT